MQTIKTFSFIAFFMAIASFSFAQTKTEKFNVSGNCGMCKSTIEKAAKAAGATTATWNAETKELTVKYNTASTNAAKIQQKVAGAGYDNVGFKATDEAYKKLHGCCQYERTTATTKEKAACCADAASCKDHDHQKEGAKPDCCKDGKCTKEGHSGVDCCKH